MLIQAATPLTDSPTEERQDSLFCSFDDSPLSQVDDFFTFDQIQTLAEQIDQVSQASNEEKQEQAEGSPDAVEEDP